MLNYWLHFVFAFIISLYNQSWVHLQTAATPPFSPSSQGLREKGVSLKILVRNIIFIPLQTLSDRLTAIYLGELSTDTDFELPGLLFNS